MTIVVELVIIIIIIIIINKYLYTHTLALFKKGLINRFVYDTYMDLHID